MSRIYNAYLAGFGEGVGRRRRESGLLKELLASQGVKVALALGSWDAACDRLRTRTEVESEVERLLK